MSKYTAQDVKRIARQIRRSKDSAPFNLLIGAGCSLSAGIPLSSDLVKEINESYEHECKRHLSEEERSDYGKCMSVLSLEERRNLLRTYLDNAKVNWAHIAIASLMKDGFIDRVLTFNFDSVLMRACGICALYPKIYDFATASAKSDDLIVPPAIVHLHGQGYGLAMMNSTGETEEHARSLEGFLQNVLNKNPLIVVGYSGESDAVFPVMTRVFEGQQRIYWLGYGDSPSRRVTDFLNKGGNSAEFLGGAYADRILVEIARELDVFPPQVFKDPYKHLLREIEPVQEYPFGDSGSGDILKELRLELKGKGEERAKRPDISSLMTQGKWDEVIELADPQIPEQADSLSWAYIMKGNTLLNQANLNKDEKLFRQSFSKYAEAIKVKSNKYEAFICWGDALSVMAKLKQDEGLFQESFGKYAEVIKIKPDDYNAFNNWGIALSNLASLKKDEKLFQQAFEKYAEAIEIKPSNHTALNNWGLALGNLAKLKEDEYLFQQAFEKYAEAIKIKSNKHEAFYNWGVTMADFANLKEDENLLQQSCDKYAEVLKIKPDHLEALDNWGATLSEMANRREDENLFREAFSKYAEAIKIKPDDVNVLNNWGIALGNLAKIKKDEDMFKQACSKYAEAVKIKPDEHESFDNWGTALLERFALKQDDTLLEEAERVLLKAQELNPDQVYNLACVKARRGQHKECQKLLEHCKSVDTLPSKDHLKSDPDLESVRDEEWFRKLLD